jgi:hypothetical protein
MHPGEPNQAGGKARRSRMETMNPDLERKLVPATKYD